MKKIYLLALVIIFANTLSGQINKTKFLKFPDLKEARFFGINQQKNRSNPVIQKNKKQLLSQTSVIKQRLDSVDIQTFDSIKNMFSTTFKILYTYDSHGNVTLSSNYYWDNISTRLEVNKTEYTYDSSGNKTLESNYIWNASQNYWQNSLKTDYTYNADKRITSEIISHGLQDQWVYFSKEEYIYDQKGNILTDLLYYFNSVTFEPNYKKEYTYNEFDNISNYIYYVSNGGGNWANQKKVDYFYNSNKNDTTELSYLWNYIKSDWEISTISSTSYSYNQNNKVTGIISTYSYFDNITNQWTISQKTESLLDNNGNITSESNYHWDSSSNSLVGDDKLEFQYDYNYSVNDVLFGDFSNLVTLENGNKLNSYQSYLSLGIDWILLANVDLFYSPVEIQSATKNLLADNINLYPNPVITSFQLNGLEGTYTLILSDLNGRIMFTKQLTGNESISLSTLSKGMYIIKIISNIGTFERKVSKE